MGAYDYEYVGGSGSMLPDTYEVVVGHHQAPVRGYESAQPHGAYGQVALPPTERAPIVRQPIYSMSDLSALHGKPPEQVTATQMQLYNSGYLTGEFRVGIYDEKTYDALEQAMAEANANGLTLGQLYNRIQKGSRVAGGLSSSSGYGSSGGSAPDYSPYTNTATTTSTQENVNLTGRGTARGILITYLEDELGREPTRKEVTRFLRGLNAAERKHPSVSKTESTTTTTTDPSRSGDSTTDTESESSTVTKQSKVDPAAKAEHFAETVAPKEAERFQTARFVDVIASMLDM